MVDQPLLAAGSTDKRGPTAQAAKESKGESRVLHALDRLTFGPRPGEVCCGRGGGPDDVWCEMQLNPQEDRRHGVEARLAQFPAMQLSQQELMSATPASR